MFKKATILIVFLAVILAGATFMWVNRISQKVFKGLKSVTPVDQSLKNNFENKIPFDFLLVGYGGGNHDGAYLTDSIIAVHIDPKQKKADLISIPRDLWVKLESDKIATQYAKINAAYAYGGNDLAKKTISMVTGLKVRNLIGVDFSGFTKTIDTLGGVDINVETTFTDPEYPIDGKEKELCGTDANFNLIKDYINNPKADQNQLKQLFKDHAGLEEFFKNITDQPEKAFPCRYETLHFNKGMTHMNGATALKYVRSRHSAEDGTDFGRAKRQRNLIMAVKQKVLSIGFITKAIPFMDSLKDDVATDLTIDDIKVLIQNSGDLKDYKISNFALTDQNVLKLDVSDDGQSIIIPKAGLDRWDYISNWINDRLNGIPEPVAPVVLVQNGTSKVGVAQIATNKLIDEGITTIPPQGADTQDVKKTNIYISNKNIEKDMLNLIKKTFNVSDVTYKESSISAYNVLVILGADEIK